MTNTTVYRIETPRLVLRCFEPVDAAGRKDAVDASGDHLRAFRRWSRDTEPVEVHLAHVRSCRGKFDLDQDQLFAVVDVPRSRFIGEIGLLTRAGPGAREVGYWIRSEDVGKGFASEALQAVVHIAFEFQGIERLDIRCAVDNAASAAVARKAGFVHEGTLRHRRLRPDDVAEDDLAFSVIRRDLAGRQPPSVRAFDIVGAALG